MRTGNHTLHANPPQSTQPATMEDVARAAGVSSATVSRALNKPDSVSAKVLARVRSAVDALNYMPHGAARALARRRTNTVAAITPALDNAIFARCIAAMQRTLSEAGYRLLLGSSEYSAKREVQALEALVEGGIDGVMLVGTAHEERLFELLERARIPCVQTFAYEPEGLRPCIGFDNRRAAAQLARHLLDLGHRRFAMIAGLTRHNDRARQRLAGVRLALEERGLELAPERVIEAPYTVTDGRAAFRRLITADPPPTAVLCGNDTLAIGALSQASTMGIAVPGAVSITGFDDLEVAAYTSPPLTTVRIDAAEMGERAADFLVRRIAGEAAEDKVETDAQVTVRASTGPPGR